MISVAQIEIYKKIENFTNRAVEAGQVAETTPKPVFWSLGGPCDQNESYTSLVRPFLKKLGAREVGAFLVDFPEMTFWSVE